VVVLIIGIAATAAGATFTSASLSRRQQDDLERRAEQYRALIQRRVGSYVEVLHGLRGLFATNGQVTRRQFATFVDIGRFTSRYPGTVGVSFDRAVAPESLGAFVATVRADTSLNGDGYPAFKVQPDQGTDTRVVVDFIEPMSGNEAAFGFDLASEPTRRAAVEEARDTGEAIATPPIRLIQDRNGPPAFLLFLAIYDTGTIPLTDAARRRHFVGVATIMVRTQEMLETVLGRPSDVRLQLFDVGPIVEQGHVPLGTTNLVYSSGAPNRAPGRDYRGSFDLDVGTRRWRLLAAPGRGFTSSTERLTPWGVALAGAAVTLLLTGLVRSSGRARHRAELIAADMTADLRSHAAELQRSNTELERFAYIASHDLQEPLRMVTSYVGRLGERYSDQLDERGRRYVHYAVDGAERMRGLIDALLEYSRVGRAEPRRAPLAMNGVVEGVQRTLRSRIQEADAHLVVDSLPTVDADEILIRQLIQNLLANALKFRHPERRPEIHVSAQRLGGAWQFAIDDNGIGIEPRYRDRVFEVFRRLQPAVEYPGAGIGLAICQRIVDHHGGRIWIEASPLGGIRVLFTLQPPEH
jgi:signal transduction histidine kinase/type II secretory pathway pseudopilin PulG